MTQVYICATKIFIYFEEEKMVYSTHTMSSICVKLCI